MSTAPALQELRSIFTHFDTENSGSLSCASLREVLHKAGMTTFQVERIVHAMDQDRSGNVEWTEFIAAALSISVCGNARLVEACFSVIDKDRDGLISMRDFADVFAK